MSTSGDRLNGKERKFPKGSAFAKEEFINLRAENLSYDAIAARLGVSRQCLQNWSKELNVEIANAKAFRLDAIKVRLRLTQIHRTEIFGEMLEKVRSELLKRDLSDLSTEKLLEIFLKYNRALVSEDTALEFAEMKDPNVMLNDTLCSKQRVAYSME